jgi:CBS domain-containing protein
MKAREVMTENPKTCAPDHDLACALRIMREEDCGIVPITEGNGEARVLGVVTDRDIALYLGSSDAKPSSVRVRDVMSTKLVACSPDDGVKDVTAKMQDAQVRRILVVEDDHLRGVISTADVARAQTGSGRMEKEVGRLIERVSEPGGPRAQS